MASGCTGAANGADAKCTACTASAADTVACTTCEDGVAAIGGRCGGKYFSWFL